MTQTLKCFASINLTFNVAPEICHWLMEMRACKSLGKTELMSISYPIMVCKPPPPCQGLPEALIALLSDRPPTSFRIDTELLLFIPYMFAHLLYCQIFPLWPLTILQLFSPAEWLLHSSNISTETVIVKQNKYLQLYFADAYINNPLWLQLSYSWEMLV